MFVVVVVVRRPHAALHGAPPPRIRTHAPTRQAPVVIPRRRQRWKLKPRVDAEPDAVLIRVAGNSPAAHALVVAGCSAGAE